MPQDAVQQVDLAKLIIRQFKRIAWPSSKLVVQPRGGRTLVNFETNFYTPDHRSIDQSVTVAGQSVVIRAVPVSYAYLFGDGDSTTTASPGSPHPDLEITHAYARTGGVVVRVDTTYAGEYRIGQGEWTSIPDTLTVRAPGRTSRSSRHSRSSSSSSAGDNVEDPSRRFQGVVATFSRSSSIKVVRRSRGV